MLRGELTPFAWLDALGSPYKANKACAPLLAAVPLASLRCAAQIIGTGSRTVNSVLSLVTKKYPRALLVIGDRLLCLKARLRTPLRRPRSRLRADRRDGYDELQVAKEGAPTKAHLHDAH